jgi:hypothetical protein
MERDFESCDYTRNTGPYYGLRIHCEGIPAAERKLIYDFIWSILPRRSKVPYAESMWRFVLLEDGTVSEIHRNPAVRHRDDLPNRYLFTEAYDQLYEGLAALNIDPPPPPRPIEDVNGWRAADQFDREIRRARETWPGWLRDKLAAVRLCQGFPQVVYPSVVSNQEQMRCLQEWIDARVADGKLLAAISPRWRTDQRVT